MELDNLMKIQKQLQIDLFPEIQKFTAEKQLLMNTHAMSHEVLEVERELNWKHWKKAKQIDWDLVKNEIVDEFIFLINQSNIVQMDAEELIQRTLDKIKVNKLRQATGY